MTEKSVGAYKTISEVSKLIDVASHVLRFWETKFSSVKPLKRSGGRRYYNSEDIEVLSKIRSLLYNEGYTIKGAQKVLRSSKRAGVEKQISSDLTEDSSRQLAKNSQNISKQSDSMQTDLSILKLLRDSEERLDSFISGLAK
ncbi:MerR family transcriptional regulator [Alphaproteobacteria bacterium]|nr:MerR family transcriptional regulator [Alphaproteobacteria bacterium]MDA9190294.1 MerR family transcriptional regulator [Alphaproteobacteria bacterium]MDC0395255.1 MerR family transcriptional regulator [Alphaproteobacteria bacterium]MDC0461499.1 MerR family transcriptional regulator [Alphaproteobacteria bacterium]